MAKSAIRSAHAEKTQPTVRILLAKKLLNPRTYLIWACFALITSLFDRKILNSRPLRQILPYYWPATNQFAANEQSALAEKH